MKSTGVLNSLIHPLIPLTSPLIIQAFNYYDSRKGISSLDLSK